MSQQIEDGGPAFPAPEAGSHHFGDPAAYMGMSLRDWFAGQALQGILAGRWNGTHDDTVKSCYLYADAMIAARKGAKP